MTIGYKGIPIVDGLRYDRKSGPVVEFLCPVCKQKFIQAISVGDDEGSLVKIDSPCCCLATGCNVRIR